GVTASFGTNPTTGSSVLTIAASSTATTGSSTVTITGTSGSLSASTTVTLTIASSGNSSGCDTAWSSTQVYTGGMTASENGINYLANWWNLGQNPATNNGGAGSGQPWTSQGACQ
ncbi:MAG: chitinase, partial [Terracidiphilus sp.]